mgnify:CR=1 FL=1
MARCCSACSLNERCCALSITGYLLLLGANELQKINARHDAHHNRALNHRTVLAVVLLFVAHKREVVLIELARKLKFYK